MTETLRSQDKLRAALVLMATIGMIAFNWLAATGAINGVKPNVISDKYPTLITPSNYAFSIWSLIYVGLIAFSIFQLLPSKISRFNRVRSIYIFSCVLNCVWVYLFQYEQIATAFVVILLLLGALTLLSIKLNGCSTLAEIWLMQAPIGLYFGWVMVAAVVNFMATLTYIQVRMSPSTATLLGSALMLFAAVTAVLVRVKLWNFFYPLPIAWALTAIAIRQGGNTMIVAAAAVGVVICLVTTGSFVSNLRDSTSE